jgi:hypothetical protein
LIVGVRGRSSLDLLGRVTAVTIPGGFALFGTAKRKHSETSLIGRKSNYKQSARKNIPGVNPTDDLGLCDNLRLRTLMHDWSYEPGKDTPSINSANVLATMNKFKNDVLQILECS